MEYSNALVTSWSSQNGHRVVEAFMKMKKFDIETLLQAYQGDFRQSVFFSLLTTPWQKLLCVPSHPLQLKKVSNNGFLFTPLLLLFSTIALTPKPYLETLKIGFPAPQDRM